MVFGVTGVIVFVLILAIIGWVMSAGAVNSVGASHSSPSPVAVKDIPPQILKLCILGSQKYSPDIPWEVVCGVTSVETNQGRSTLPGVRSGVNAYGCCAGIAQFSLVLSDGGIGPGKLRDNETNSSTWGAFGVDGDRDGWKNVYDPYDAVLATARYLQHGTLAGENPCPSIHLGDYGPKVITGVYNYNHACWYVERVLEKAVTYKSTIRAVGPTSSGKVIIAAGANLPGQPITPETMAFLEKVAGIYGKQLIVTTGTNHSYYSSSGLVSDHPSGHAADFGMIANGGYDDSPVGDRIDAACLIAAGVSPSQALQIAQVGGLWTLHHSGLRIQCIWKTYEGGNHHNHVHIGARPE